MEGKYSKLQYVSIFEDRKEEIYLMMHQLGFVLCNASENEFLRGAAKVGLVTDGDLDSFANIHPSQLEFKSIPAQARYLGLPEYLACYEASSKDRYRRNVHNKKDDVKKELIKLQITS